MPNEVRDRLKHAPELYDYVECMHDQEYYILHRTLGTWILHVNYYQGLSTGSYLSYNSSLLTVIKRMRNFSNPRDLEIRSW